VANGDMAIEATVKGSSGKSPARRIYAEGKKESERRWHATFTATPNARISLSRGPSSLHSPCSRLGAAKPSPQPGFAHLSLPNISPSSDPVYPPRDAYCARLLRDTSCMYGSKFFGDGVGLELG